MSGRWQIDEAPSETQLSEIAEVLRDGKVVLLPTDTIYGLHAIANDPAAVERIAEIKGRGETKSFIVLASSLDEFPQLGISADAGILRALESIWPAPLTAVLPLRQPVPASRGARTLAVRIPALDWLRALIARTGPLVSTSANRSGEPAVDHPSRLARELQNAVDGIVDRGTCVGKPSAVVDLSEGEPRLIRPGEASFTQKLWKSLRKSL